ncbi:MAG TPA: TonB-dependent receptor [Bryobacteraceae bacterium]|nr:TonB-dependent receptor [Bryobacteraceae bacterium]
MNKIRFELRMAAALFLFASVLAAQAPIGNISGVVRDPSGAVVAGAQVKATSANTAAVRNASTNDEGYFLLSTLQPGEYKVQVTSPGFSEATVQRVTVEVGQTARVEIALALSAASTQVQVGGEAVQVDTERTTLGGVVTAREIDQLPLNGRNYLELARLEPGVEIQDGKTFDPTKTRYTGVSIAGRQGREARITLDGVDVVDEHVGTTTLNISQETIQEFQVSTSNADSSTGITATGGVNVITKSGSNDYHGSAFAFGRGSNMAARPNFGAVKPDFDREQYGAGLGGRLIRDKLFFFGNFEKTRESSAISVATPYFPNLTSFPAPYDQTSSSARADWQVNAKNQTFFRWTRNEDSNFGGFGGNAAPSSGNINADVTDQWAMGWDTVFSPRLTNGFRMAVTNFRNRIQRPPSEAQQFAVPGAENFRILTSDNSLIAGPDNNTPQGTEEYFNQYRDDLTYNRGSHTIRFGGGVTYRQLSVFNFAQGFPSITVNAPASPNVADLLNATIVSIVIGNRKGIRLPATPDNSYRNTRYAAYVEDQWRVRPGITLSYGVRYEVDTHPVDNDLKKPDIVRPLLARGTDATPLNTKNFAPHVGIAWAPTKDHKTAIRAGFGLFYAQEVSNLVTNERASLAPFNSGNDTVTLAAGSSGFFDFSRGAGTSTFDFTPALTGNLKNALPIISAGQAVYIAAPQLTVPTLQVTGTGLAINNNLRTPYNMQYNAGVQRELPMNTVIDVNFIYSRSVHDFTRDIDGANIFPGNGAPIILGDGTKPTKQITIVNSDGFSRYRALTVRIDKRFSRQFQYTASYALSRFETTVPDGLGLGSGALVNRNVKANFGPGSLDRTQRLVLNGIVNLPFGVRASMISTWYSGLPASVLVGSADLNGDGINGDFLPGTRRGSLGRDVDSVQKLNSLIDAYNQSTGGKPLPRGGRAPFVLDVPDSTRFGDSFISQDLALSKDFKIREKMHIEFTAQMFNVFNISNLVGSAGFPGSAFNGTLTTVNSDNTGAPTGGFKLGGNGGLLNAAGNRALASVDRATAFASFSAIRPSIPTGSGLPRASQFGLRIRF